MVMNKLFILLVGFSTILLSNQSVYAEIQKTHLIKTDQELQKTELSTQLLDQLLDLSLDELMELEITTVATGLLQTVAQAPASTTVITAQNIEAMGARNLEEVLKTVPGMHISASEYRFAPLYDVRGVHSANNYEILMMVDGIPIKSVVDGMRGSREESWIPPPIQQIQRVEVIRGPGSALYGADAVSGVVNIITKTAKDIRDTETGVRFGSYQTYNPWMLHSQKLSNGMELALSVDYLDTDGHRQTVHQDLQTTLDHSGGTALSQTPGRAYLQKRQLNVSGVLTKDHWRLGINTVRARGIGAGLGLTLLVSPEEHHETNHYQIDLGYHNPNFTKHWEIKLQLSYRDLADDIFQSYTVRPGGMRNNLSYPYGSPNNTGYFQQQTRLDLSGQYKGFKNHNVRLGMGTSYADLYKTTWSFLLKPDEPLMIDSKLENRTLLPENIRQNRYLFAQDSWNFATDWELTTGIRYDWYSDFDSALNPRLALVWQTFPRLTTKLLYGSAFRAPSFVEMYTPLSRVEVGNPHLKAETSRTLEVIFDYRASRDLSAAINLFDYKIKDKVQRRLINFADRTIYTYDNVGLLKGRGFELESRWRMTEVSTLEANYAFAKVTDGAGMEAGNYPHHHLYLQHNWLLNANWSFNTQLNWVADRERPVSDVREKLSDYTELDLTLRYKSLQTPWSFSVGVRNLLDEDRREPGDLRLIGDYPKAGREWFGEIRYKF